MHLPGPLVSAAWLASHLGQVAIADCRFSLAEPSAGRARYTAAHIPGAVYFDLDRDLSGPPGPHGGRHPLPDPALLAAKLGQAGIGDATPVVAYDDSGEMAARFWWLLRYLGHAEVAVLDGGLAAYQGDLTAAPSTPAPRSFTPSPRPELVVDYAGVRERPPGTAVVDSRAPERYAGQPHPLDARPGHIPGAVNHFWKEVMRADGTYKSPAELAAVLGDLQRPAAVVVHCGSGVTACPNLLALELLGRTDARLYAGSWSDWTSYPDAPIER